jgi:hypothetical protein
MDSPDREDTRDPKEVIAEQARGRRYAIAVECFAVLAGLGAIAFAYHEGRAKHPSVNGFWLDIGVSVGTALILVGVLLRIQRAIAARLDATSAALTAVQKQFASQLNEINERITEIADKTAPNATHPQPVTPEYRSPEPVSELLGEWLARQLHRLLDRPLRILRTRRHTILLGRLKLRLLFMRIAGSVLARWVLGVAACGLISIAVVLLVIDKKHHSRIGLDTSVEELPAASSSPENSAAAHYAASTIATYCQAAANEPGDTSTVECPDLSEHHILITLTRGGPWTLIEFTDDQPSEVKVTSGNCEQPHGEGKVIREKFQSGGHSGEVYCYTDDEQAVFKWYFGRGEYVASAQLNVGNESWQSAYQLWLADRELLLASPVSRYAYEHP